MKKTLFRERNPLYNKKNAKHRNAKTQTKRFFEEKQGQKNENQNRVLRTCKKDVFFKVKKTQ